MEVRHMCHFQKCALLFLCILGLLPGRIQAGTTTECTGVVDGDTLTIQVKGRDQTVDLEGIDAPELDQAQGQEAKDFLSNLVLGKKLKVEIRDPKAKPPIARITLDGKNVSREMLAAGFAWIGETQNEDDALAAITARSAKKGLWKETDPIPPSIWRNRKPVPTPAPTPEPTIRSLSVMAARTELEKNKRGKTIISGLPQVKSGEEETTEGGSSGTSFHLEFSCPQDGLADCAETQFKASYEEAAGQSPGAIARSQQNSEGGGHLFIFTGDGFSIPVVCQCPEEGPCACAIDITTMAAEVRMDDTINGESTLALIQQIEAKHPHCPFIPIICDNASYYRSKAVRAYLKTSRAELIFLPPYSPNLNLIERLWRFMKREILYGTYYATFKEFKTACDKFFRELGSYESKLRSLLTENFQILGV